jgi:hypothetical protein
MLQNQHADHDLGRRAWTSATPALGPAALERLRDHLNHVLVLEQYVDSLQPVGPQLVPIGQ